MKTDTKIDNFFNIKKFYNLSNTFTIPSNKGIYNMGKTCYINSILQCLFNVYELSDYLIQEKYKKDIKEHVLKEEDLNLLKKYKFYNKNYWSNESLNSLNIVHLIKAINNTSSEKLQYMLNEEEDAYMFLINTINKLHNILKYKIKLRLNIKNNGEDKNITNLEKYINFFKENENNNYSEILKLFYGTYLLTYECVKCKNRTKGFEIFNSISIDSKIDNSCKNSVIELSDILKNYFKEEEIEKECEKCKERKTLKKTTIFYLPNNIIIHLKRTLYIQGEENKTSKNTNLINYPINNLDLTKLLEKEVSSNNYIYDLYSICNHIGENDYNGHYTSLIRSLNNEWVYYNDENVINLTERSKLTETQLLNTIVSKDAYILFYKRKFIN
jgi:ubiquitin carboxyl-terminal hydrolase 8